MSSNFCVCCGAEIPEGTQVCLRCQKNGGPLPHKSADEMFRGLGYRRNESVCYGYEKGKIIYEKSVMGGTDIFQIVFFKSNKWCVYAENLARLPFMMDKFEIEAVYKKLCELYAHRDLMEAKE